MNSNYRWAIIFSAAVLFLCMAAAGTAAEQSENPVVVIETTEGNITIELFKDKAPKTVENFLAYAKSNFYRGTIFHRVIKNFMIQGGGFTQEMGRKKTRPPIPNEATNGLSNKRGTIAMARTGEINSATAQFFINTVDNKALDHRGESPPDRFGYCVFGKVTSGMGIVDRIEDIPTGTRGAFQNYPMQPVVIKNVRIKN